MHFRSAAATALFSSLAIAGPLEQRADTPKKTFTVNQVAVQQQVVPPALQVLRTYAKYSKNPPAKVVVAAKAAVQSGSVVASPQNYDLAYLSRVTVGGQIFDLNFDTGSADLWLHSTLQPATQRNGRTVYDPTKSKNATLMSGQTWQITYGDGSGAAGKVYADTVVIGGVTATSQAVEAATSVSQQFMNDIDADGLVGLAFSNLNMVRPRQQSTFFDTIGRTLPSKLFTADLKKGAAGSYDFGFINSAKYSGAITYAPVQASTGFWQFTMGGYQVGGKAARTASLGNAIADTGTTLLYLGDSVVSEYWSAVYGAYYSNQFGAYVFPCNSFLPTFAISISGRNFVIPGNYMNYAPISNTMCFGGLQSNANFGFSLLGDVFLKSVFVVFDQSTSTPRIGFANKAGVSDDSDPEAGPDSDPDSSPDLSSISTSELPLIDSTTTSLISSSPPTTIITTAPITTSTTPTTCESTTSRDASPLAVLSLLSALAGSVSISVTTSASSTSSSSLTNAYMSSVVSLMTSAKPRSSSASGTVKAPVVTTTTTTRKATTTTTTTTKRVTTTMKVTTPVKKVTTTHRVVKKVKTTAKKLQKLSKARRLSVCNGDYIAAIKKKYPKHPVRFCKNYKPKAGARSIVPGIPSSAATVKVCKCLLAAQ